MPTVGAETRGPAAAEGIMRAVVRALQWGLDRMLSVGYGVVYDAIFERFPPYQDLQAEVLELVEKSAPDAPRRDVHVLDVGCGPGNFTFVLAEAGFSTIGLEAYGATFEFARKRVGRHYWDGHEFAGNLTAAGLTVLGMRRTFLNGASVLVWARRDVEAS